MLAWPQTRQQSARQELLSWDCGLLIEDGHTSYERVRSAPESLGRLPDRPLDRSKYLNFKIQSINDQLRSRNCTYSRA